MAAQGTGGSGFSRRSLVTGMGLGAVGLFSAPLLAACSSGSGGGSGASGGSGGGKGGSMTFGSNASDPVPKKAIASLIAAFEKKDKAKVDINTSDHNSFQNKITNYLQGSPDDAFTWFAGYRMRYFAAKDLVGDASDVWKTIGSNFSPALKKASTGDDGKQYFVPIYNYPWGFFYRKSFWKQNGWEVPKTWDELIALAKKMKTKGIIPVQFADKDGWPADGTFDYLNMRLNGYQFHLDLAAHKESWNQQKVKDIFDTWNELRPHYDPAALGLTWQQGAQKLGKKQSGMYLLGSFVTQQFTDKAVLDDIGFFQFPSVKVEGQDALEAPIDGLMLSKKGEQNATAKDLLAFTGTGAGQYEYWKNDPNNIMTAKDADTSHYTPFIKELAGVIANAKNISQFFDRDALPAMANNVVNPALQNFFKSGTVDLANLDKQAKSLYANG
jgi:multiple sugar transport system substrate-binding protein